MAAPREQAFSLWLTDAGVRQFLAPAAVIRPIIGGEYTIIFNPDLDPSGAALGTRGARILALDPPRRLVVEWTMPPFAAELNTRPLPTWVDLAFEEASSQTTRVMLAHRGFGMGSAWDAPFEWFSNEAWPYVMRRLAGLGTAG